MAGEAAESTVANVNAVADNTTHTEGVKAILRELWNNHQTEILRFGKAFLLALVIALLAWLLTRFSRRLIELAVRKVPTMDDAMEKILASIAKTLIWVLSILTILDLFGVNTTSLLAVLGAAGLAVGLALKDSLSNIASGMMLLFLRPYKVGDFIDCGSIAGTIMEMGLFTTTVKTPDGIFVAIPNSAIFGHPIKNYSRNPTRRSDITVGIAYGDSLPKALDALRTLLLENEKVLKEPAPDVMVSELADSSVNLTLRYWTRTEDYWTVYWAIKQSLKGVIEDSGLSIPFPQRVITFVNDPGKAKPEE